MLAAINAFASESDMWRACATQGTCIVAQWLPTFLNGTTQSTEIKNRTFIAASTTTPWRRDLTILPNVQTNAKGIIVISRSSSTLVNPLEVNPLGFSSGWLKLALT